MKRTRSAPLRIWAALALFCVALTVVSGFASVQSDLVVLEHHIGGDQRTPDGGWISSNTHSAIAIHDMDVNHHHHAECASCVFLCTPQMQMATVILPSTAVHVMADAILKGILPSGISRPPRV